MKIIEGILKGMGMLLILIALVTLAFSMEVYAAELDEPCGLTEWELAGNLEHELVKYAGDFLEAEEEHGVNACFLAAIASLESGHGRYMFRPNNIFGWSGKSFESVPECIDFVAERLKRNYIDPEGKYYRGGKIADIGRIYCPGNEKWVKSVSFLFEKLSAKQETTTRTETIDGKIIIYVR